MSRRAAAAAIAFAIAAGGVLRAIPCWNDFWLDEIWTWLIASELSSPLEVFTAVHHSNNHHLNTLFFYGLGEPAHWAAYRIPALVSGIAGIALLSGLAARWGRLEAVLAALLGAFCFALIHFSSEARGYAPSIAFALGALWALELDLERPRRWTALVFGFCTALAFLSQLVSLFFWAGAVVYSARRLARRGAKTTSLGLLRLHALPGAIFAALYWLDLRTLQVGGGPPLDLAWFTSRLVGFGLGLPVQRSWAAAYALLALVLVGLGLWRLARRGGDLWLFFLVAIALAPAAGIAALRPEVVAVRYFLIGLSLVLLLLALSLADALRAGPALRASALALLALFLAGNAVHTWRFLERGRGGFEAALQTMAEASPSGRIEVGSDHDFRTGTVLRFYARRLSPGTELDYRARADWPRGGPEWLVIHRAERPEAPRDTLVLDGGERFARVAEFDHAAISGFWWGLYRRTPPEGASASGSTRRSSTTPNASERKGSAPRRATRR